MDNRTIINRIQIKNVDKEYKRYRAKTQETVQKKLLRKKISHIYKNGIESSNEGTLASNENAKVEEINQSAIGDTYILYYLFNQNNIQKRICEVRKDFDIKLPRRKNMIPSYLKKKRVYKKNLPTLNCDEIEGIFEINVQYIKGQERSREKLGILRNNLSFQESILSILDLFPLQIQTYRFIPVIEYYLVTGVIGKVPMNYTIKFEESPREGQKVVINYNGQIRNHEKDRITKERTCALKIFQNKKVKSPYKFTVKQIKYGGKNFSHLSVVFRGRLNEKQKRACDKERTAQLKKLFPNSNLFHTRDAWFDILCLVDYEENKEMTYKDADNIDYKEVEYKHSYDLSIQNVGEKYGLDLSCYKIKSIKERIRNLKKKLLGESK